MSAMVAQITSPTIVYSTVYSGADYRKHQISTSLAFVRGIHRWPVNSPHKGPVTRKMFPFDDVIMDSSSAMSVDITFGSAFIKPDQRNPWIKDQIKITLLPTISHLLLPNFVSCGRAFPSHMTQNLVTVGAKLWTADRFIVDPWSMDYADPVW